MTPLQRRLRERLGDGQARRAYYERLQIIGDNPLPEQHVRLLAVILDWTSGEVVSAIRKEAGAAPTKPFFDRYLSEAARQWPLPETLPATPHWTVMGPQQPRGDYQYLAAEKKLRYNPGDVVMSPAEDGVRFVQLPGHAVATRVWEGEEPPILLLPGCDVSSSHYTPLINFSDQPRRLIRVYRTPWAKNLLQFIGRKPNGYANTW